MKQFLVEVNSKEIYILFTNHLLLLNLKAVNLYVPYYASEFSAERAK